MIRVLLVDDEVLSIQYMRNMIEWEQNGYEVAGQAVNGRKALELIEQLEIPIVISDIKMPVMDGVELARQIRERKLPCKIILLSAYKDFEYAKQAIQYGVFNYILKHDIDENVLLEELARVKEQLEKEADLGRLVRENYMKTILYGGTLDEEMRLSQMQFGNRYVMYLVGACLPIIEGKRSTKSGLAKLVQIGQQRQAWESEDLSYVAGMEMDEEHCLILCGINQVHSLARLQEAVWEEAHSLGKLFEIAGPVRILCSGEKKLEELKDTFQELSNGIRYIPFMRKQVVWYLQELPVIRPDELIGFEDRVAAVFQALSQGDSKGLEELTEVFEWVGRPFWNLTALKHLLRALHLRFRDFEKEYGIARAEEENCWVFWEECLFAYQERYQNDCKCLQEYALGQYSQPVAMTLKFVHAHYQEEITLDTMGSYLDMNGVYLGQIFKKETGTTLLKYLTKYRMEEAKRLLWGGQYQVSQIAEMVGYKTSQYFSQSFYKATGMAPLDYKKWGESGCTREK